MAEDFIKALKEVSIIVRRHRRGLRRTAHHEAGHAVAMIALGFDVVWAAVRPAIVYPWDDPLEASFLDEIAEVDDDLGCAGMVLRARHSYQDMYERLDSDIIVHYAGPAAEARFLGHPVRITGTDKTNPMRYCPDFPTRTETKAYLDEMKAIAANFVLRRWPQIQAVATELIETRHLTGRQVKAIIRKTV